MILNDLWARLKVIDSLNATKMAKYSLVMTPTPCRVVGCIISITCRPRFACAAAFTYLLTYAVGSRRIEPAISPNGLKIERKLLLTAYRPIKWQSRTRAFDCRQNVTLNDLCARFKVTDCLNVAKMAKYSLVMTPTPSRVPCLFT